MGDCDLANGRIIVSRSWGYDARKSGDPVTVQVHPHLDAILRLGREYLAADGGGGSAAGFIAWLEMTMRGDDDPTPGAASDAVQLVSFHRAKGLEWELVCVTGVERGLVPISYATESDALDEERRLLHVALSRAGQYLHISWARRRTVGGRPAASL